MHRTSRSRSAHEHLRTATAREHRAAEAALGLDGRMTLEAHRRLLTVFLAVFAPVEDVLSRWQRSHPGGWRVQRRSDLAEADLRHLGCAPVAAASPRWPVRPPPDGAAGAPEALGYGYALEGSRLGAVVIGERLAGERPAAPSTFFAAGDRGRWRSFLSVLNGSLVEERARERAASAARSVFSELVSQASRPPRG